MINNFSKKIAFSALRMIKHGKIIVTDYDQSKHVFGNDENLIVFVKINRSDFFKKIISFNRLGAHARVHAVALILDLLTYSYRILISTILQISRNFY